MTEMLMDHEAWERVRQATGGAADPCYQCAACTAVCPWAEVRPNGSGIRSLIRAVQLGLPAEQELLWLCTTCGACEPNCPRGVDISRVVQGLRQLAWRENSLPRGLAGVVWAVLRDGNPWERPPSQRTAWAKGLDLPAYSPAEHDFLYYTGCTSAYDPRAQRIARSLVNIWEHAGCRFGSLGEGEPCCGDAAWSMGNQPYVQHLVAENSRLFERAGVTRLVSTSPHCHHLFARVYPQQGDGPEALHYTQQLEELVQTDALRWASSASEDGDRPLRIAYHDPCYLGRKLGVYEAPRRVLAAIPGVELVEFETARAEALCCGGGGGRMWQETRAEDRFGTIRMQEAHRQGADLVATACPHCLSCLEDGARATGPDLLPVMDVAEVVAHALQHSVADLRDRGRDHRETEG